MSMALGSYYRRRISYLPYRKQGLPRGPGARPPTGNTAPACPRYPLEPWAVPFVERIDYFYP